VSSLAENEFITHRASSLREAHHPKVSHLQLRSSPITESGKRIPNQLSRNSFKATLPLHDCTFSIRAVYRILSENERTDETNSAPYLSGDDEQDRVVAALDFLRGSAERDGKAYWQTSSSWQEARHEEWAESLGLLLDFSDFADRPKLDQSSESFFQMR